MIWVVFILGILIAWNGVVSANENGVRKDNVGLMLLGLFVAMICIVIETA